MTEAFNNKQRKIIRDGIRSLVDDYDSVDAAVVVTIDGNMLEKHEKAKNPMKRLATMGSSLMSLGDTITSELGMGTCKNIISENEGGLIAFMHIAEDLVLVSMSYSTGSLGLLLSASRKCAASIGSQI